MLGIYLAIFGAVILVFADTQKKQFGEKYSNEVIIWNTVFIGAMAGFLACYCFEMGVSHFPSLWWIPLTAALLIVGEIAFIRAIVTGDFSEVAPIRATAPVFSVLFALVAFGEFPTTFALVGIALVIAGVWMLSPRNRDGHRLLSPGVRYMIAAQFFGVLMALTIKAASIGVSPLFCFSCAMLGELLYFSGKLIKERETPLVLYRDSPLRTVSMGLLWGVGIVLVSIAPSYTLAAYAYASSQIYMPVAFAVSVLVLKEGHASHRLLPMLVILGGVLLVIFGAYQ